MRHEAPTDILTQQHLNQMLEQQKQIWWQEVAGKTGESDSSPDDSVQKTKKKLLVTLFTLKFPLILNSEKDQSK